MKKIILALVFGFMFSMNCLSADNWQLTAKQNELNAVNERLRSIGIEMIYMQERANALVKEKTDLMAKQKVIQEELKKLTPQTKK